VADEPDPPRPSARRRSIGSYPDAAWWPVEGDEPDPRWSLANERTFLAYNRTALALIVAGLAVTGSRAAADVPRWLAFFGIPFLALGAYVAVAGRHRMVEAQRAMRMGEPMPAPPLGTVLTVGLVAVAVIGAGAAFVDLVVG
jgi:putative membrane protein